LKDENVILRFIRFFYNISRKRESVGKDIADQLPSSIKLMVKYSKSKTEKFDVCDLIDYAKNRTVLLDSEEVYKLSLYKKPPVNSKRDEIEKSLWTAEDNISGEGKIGQLFQMLNHTGVGLISYYSSYEYGNITGFDLAKFNNIYNAYIEFTDNLVDISGDLINRTYIVKGNRVCWVDEIHENTAFLQLVLSRFECNLKTKIELEDFLIMDEVNFIMSYADEKAIENEVDPKKQLFIYFILLKRILSTWNCDNGLNFGMYDSSIYADLIISSIFSHKIKYQMFSSQWRYNDRRDDKGIWAPVDVDNVNYRQKLIDWANEV
jgi:hypothetical protein